jgi:Tfp pilus assembly PilM family ATPase
MLCWAMAREDSMRYVDLFKSTKCKLVGLHSQVRALVSAFEHLNRRSSDSAVCTMYVDLGWGGMKIVVAHGTEMVFAKQVQIGGRQLDGLVAEGTGCDVFTARMRRIADGLSDDVRPHSTARERSTTGDGLAVLRAGIAREGGAEEVVPELRANGTMMADDRRTGVTPPELANEVEPSSTAVMTGGVDCSELLESMADELSLCSRYHASLFGGRKIDRLVFLGGESRSTALCRRIAQALNVPAQLGDPLARFADGPNDERLPDPGHASPSWAVACGLCTAPVDL